MIALTGVIVAMTSPMAVAGQHLGCTPDLIVNIIINGLDEECITLLHDHLSAGGIRRLTDEGIYLRNVNFGAPYDSTAATAVIMTGTSPAVNGVTATVVYNTDKNRSQSVFFDTNYIGNFTDETLSPRQILVSTLSDEVKASFGVSSAVHSLAAIPEQAIVLAGHAANSAFWLNDKTGKWSTTTFYKDVPQVVQTANYTSPLSSRIDTMTWSPAWQVLKYPTLSRRRVYYPFTYTFQRRGMDGYLQFKASPLANTEITTAAVNYIRNLNLGKHESPDMLNIAFSLQPVGYAKNATARFETLDAYVRLDADLKRLFSAINANVGLKNTAIIVAGTPMKKAVLKDNPDLNIPSGTFSSRRAISLLNMYLMAKYGNVKWVVAYHNRQFYLDRKAITDAKLDLPSFRSDASAFLEKMAGVVSAKSVDNIESRKAFHASTVGDVLIEVNPGWEIDEGNGTPTTVVRADSSCSVAFLLFPNHSPNVISENIDAEFLAPTVARLLHIRSPNASAHAPLLF